MYINEKAPLHLVQRLVRGWSDEDLWDITPLIVGKIRKPLKACIKHIIKEGYGVPSKLIQEQYPDLKGDGRVVKIGDKKTKSGKIKSDTQLRKEWISVLKKIERAFDLYYYEEMKSKNPDGSSLKEWEEITEGFELFGKYMTSLGS